MIDTRAYPVAGCQEPRRKPLQAARATAAPPASSGWRRDSRSDGRRGKLRDGALNWAGAPQSWSLSCTFLASRSLTGALQLRICPAEGCGVHPLEELRCSSAERRATRCAKAVAGSRPWVRDRFAGTAVRHLWLLDAQKGTEGSGAAAGRSRQRERSGWHHGVRGDLQPQEPQGGGPAGRERSGRAREKNFPRSAHRSASAGPPRLAAHSPRSDPRCSRPTRPTPHPRRRCRPQATSDAGSDASSAASTYVTAPSVLTPVPESPAVDQDENAGATSTAKSGRRSEAGGAAGRWRRKNAAERADAERRQHLAEMRAYFEEVRIMGTGLLQPKQKLCFPWGHTEAGRGVLVGCCAGAPLLLLLEHPPSPTPSLPTQRRWTPLSWRWRRPLLPRPAGRAHSRQSGARRPALGEWARLWQQQHPHPGPPCASSAPCRWACPAAARPWWPGPHPLPWPPAARPTSRRSSSTCRCARCRSELHIGVWLGLQMMGT